MLPHSSAPTDASGESGVTNGVRWVKIIPRDSPLISHYRKLPNREFEAIRFWGSGFYGFQRKWVFDLSRFAIVNKGRQIGWSFSTAGSIALWSAFRGEVTTIVSNKEDSAIETLAKVKEHARMLRNYGSEYARTVSSSDTEVTFASGGRALAFTSKGSRSFTGNLVLDEFAHHDNQAAVWKASAPVITTGNLRMRVVSTPNGVNNEFHERIKAARDPRSAWSFYEVPIESAIASGYPVDIEACREATNHDPRLFAQEYQCSFLGNSLQYIPTNMIDDNSTDDSLIEESNAIYYAGLDIGREVDLTALVIIRRSIPSGRMRVIHVETMKRTDQDGINAMVDKAFAIYKLKRLGIDSTGLGSFPADAIKKKHSERYDVSHRRPRVELIDFTLKSKEALATGLYTALANGMLSLPATDAALPPRPYHVTREGHTLNAPGTAAQLRMEISSIQRVITQAANVKYETPRTSEGHADRAWALMLALHSVDAIHPMVRALLPVRR